MLTNSARVFVEEKRQSAAPYSTREGGTRKFLHLVFSVASVQEQDSIILDWHLLELPGVWKEKDLSVCLYASFDGAG